MLRPYPWSCLFLHYLAFKGVFDVYDDAISSYRRQWLANYLYWKLPQLSPLFAICWKVRLIGRQMHSQDLWGIPRWESLVGNWVELFSSLFLFNCNSWLAQFKTWISDELVIPLIDVQTRNQEFFRAGKFFRNLGT